MYENAYVSKKIWWTCIYICICIDTWNLEMSSILGWKNPPKESPNSIQNKGHLGYRYMYIHKHAGWTQNTGQLRTEMLDTPHISYDVMCINTIQNMTLVLFGSSTSTDHPIGPKQLKKVHESCLIKCALHAGMLWHNQLESARKSWVFCHFLPT